jgi:peptidase E
MDLEARCAERAHCIPYRAAGDSEGARERGAGLKLTIRKHAHDRESVCRHHAHRIAHTDNNSLSKDIQLIKRQIIAIGGMALPPDLANLLLVKYFLEQTRRKKPKVLFVGTAGGDAETGRLRFYAGFSQFTCTPAHLTFFARTPRDLESLALEQDAIFVGGGNTRSMLAIWRDWGFDIALRKAWERGTVLGGGSAGSICWFHKGVTDSIAGPLTALPCLGFLPGSNCPHYDSEAKRRPTFRNLVASGSIPDGVAADDGVALHYVDGRLARVVSSLPRAKGYAVTRSGRRAIERPLPTRYLGRRSP